MRRFNWAGALLPLLSLWLTPALSAADDRSETSQRQEHVQVTATRRAEDKHEVPVAVTIVDTDSIQAENPDVLAEILRGLPGTWFQQTTPGQGIPIIRGLKGSQVLHLVDGMRLNNAFFRSAPNQYLGLLDPQSVASVEVVRGAAGSLYGADAMGGVVNVLTAEPDIYGSETGASARIYSAWSSADRGWTGRGDLQWTRPGSGVSLGVGYQDRSDRENGNGVRLVPSGFRQQSADAKFLHAFGDRAELMLSAQYVEQPSTPRTDELIPGFGQSEPSSSEFEFQPNSRRFLHGRFRLQGNGAWYDTIETHLARQVVDDDRVTRDAGSTERRTEQNRSTLDGVTLQINAGQESNTTFTAGIEYYTDTVRSARQRSDLVSGQRQAVSSRFPDRSSMDQAAAYVAVDTWPTERLDLAAGLRYSHFKVHLPNVADVGDVKLTPSDLTGDLHLAWVLDGQNRLVANIGRGFRAPNIFDLGTLGPRPGNRFNAPNPALGPESVWSYDAGWKHAGPEWRGELMFFYMDYRDKITSVLTGEVTESGRDIVRSENRNEVRLYGLEAGFEWTLNPRTTLSATLNYTRGTEYDSADGSEPADRTPPLNGRIAIAYAFSDRLDLAAEVTAAAQQDRLSSRDVGDPRIDPNGTAGWSSIGVRANWQVNDDLQLGLTLENIGDRHYREHASGVDAPGFNIGLWMNASF